MKRAVPFQAGTERAAAALILCVSTGAFFPLLRGDVSDVDLMAGDPLLKAVWAVLSLVIVGLAALRLPAVMRVASRTPELLVLVAYVCVSTAWSAAPGVTLRRAVGLGITTLFGMWLAARFSEEQLVRLVAWTLGVVAAASIVVAVLAPEVGVSSGYSEGAWRGVFGLKNELGRTMALLAIAALSLTYGTRRRRWPGLLIAGVAVGMVLMADSMTALVIVVAAVAVAEALRVLRLRYNLAIPALIAVGLTMGAAVYTLFNYRAVVVDSMGRDMTFTGRTVLWAMVMENIAQRPWGGYGYGAFWMGFQGPSAGIWRVLHWHPPTAHNGYLDLALTLGVVGIVLFALGLVVAVPRALRGVMQGRPAAGWPVMLIAFMLLYNLSENALLRYNHVTWILYVATICSLARTARLQPGAPPRPRGRGRPAHAAAAPPRRRVPGLAGAAPGVEPPLRIP